ncbi:DUF6443 domain-containing protein [Aquimarina macrocephali]|uniref:DUF6443 domain-containing protein n=1 Tax=Aquimarina macrocephali TaxID=666563 RepID=UPI000A010B41|nr:DUF6443 domain-containing protein [Aquimarina macrocephali]
MKKSLFSLALSMFSLLSTAQSLDKNFTMSVVPKEAMKVSQLDTVTVSSVLKNITYYDGLGRPIQSNALGQNPNGKDIVQHYIYDQFGRTEKTYLPLASDQSTGNFISNPIPQIETYYKNKYGDDNPYSQQRFDNSPLSRVLESAAPGNDWKISSGHTNKIEYGTNTDLEIRKYGTDDLDIPPSYTFNHPVSNETYTVSQSITLTNGAHLTGKVHLKIANNDPLFGYKTYKANELFKRIIKNENWKSTDGHLNTKEVFTDKNGRKISEVSYIKEGNTTKKLVTRYIYDEFGRLIYIFPPSISDKEFGTLNGNNGFYWHYTRFFENPNKVGPAGGSLEASITNTTLTINAHAYFYNMSIKIGRIAFIQGNLPDMDLGNISTDIGNTDYIAYLKNGYFCIRSNTNPPPIIKNIDFSFQIPFEREIVSNYKEVLDNQAYQYKYDNYNRQIAQKMPGKDWQYVVYDQLDRPIFTQDYNLKSQSLWMFNKYDAIGRNIYSGKYTSTLSQKELQSQVDNAIVSSVNKSNIEERTNSVINVGEALINYTNNAFPKTGIVEITSVNYYDDYTFTDPDKPTIPSTVLGQEVSLRTKGLPTASWSKTIRSNTWTKSYPFYNYKAEEIKVYGKNHLTGTTIVETEIDFTGLIKKTITNHKRTSNSTNIQITDRFEYDNSGRLTDQYHQVNSQSEEHISKYIYNELGELTSKEIGGKTNIGLSLQKIEYTKNIRGWLKKLNDPNQNLSTDLFAFETLYNDANPTVDKLYTGTISGINWRSNISNIKKTYDYQYDNLGRLSKAAFSSSAINDTNRYTLSEVNYDHNGNITSLKRNGWQKNSSYVDMDILNYEYKGNQLIKVVDSGNKNYGFKDSNATNTNDYVYDNNGNLIRDNHKGISINYNYLNLPSTVTFDSGEKLEIAYNSTGAKLYKRFISDNQIITTEYLGDFQYQDANLLFFGQGEGFVFKEGNSFKYAYIYTDHLGNNRLAYTDLNNNSVIDTNEVISKTDYYPFGLIHPGEIQTPIASDYDFKFQGKELQKEGGLDHYDFGSRMYDPSLGRWFAVDPQGQFSSPYLAMGNNPIMMVDPNGEFSFLAALVGAFVYTAFDAAQGNVNNWEDFFKSFGTGAAQSVFAGYDSVENAAFGAAYSQFNSVATGDSEGDGVTLSFNPTYSWGSNFGGWGVNASLNGRIGNFEGAIGYGVTSFGKFDVDKGPRTVSNESRLSYSLGWNDGNTGFRLYTTKFNDDLGGQRVGGLDFTSGKFGFRYENDGFPFQYIGLRKNTASLGNGGDSNRTAALNLSYGDFSYGFNLFTGFRNNYTKDEEKLNRPLTEGVARNIKRNDLNQANLHVPLYGETYPHRYVDEEGPKYRFGAQYFAYKGYRVGWNSERNRHLIQNLRAHNIAFAKQPGFIMTHNRSVVYFQYNSYNNPYTLW